MDKKDFEECYSNRMKLDDYKERITIEVMFQADVKKALKEEYTVDIIANSEHVVELLKQKMTDFVQKVKGVLDAIKTLDEAECQKVLQLRYVEGLTMPQVAELMQVSVKTAYRIENKAFKMLGIEELMSN